MNRHLAFFLALFLPLVHAAFAQGADPRAREALRAVAAEAAASLTAANVTGGKTIALLPLGGDADGVLAGALKGGFSARGVACVEAKEDPFFDEIMKQVEWDERKEDMLDAATITRFGKLQAGQLLLYGWVRQCDVTPRRAYAEIELHLSSVETQRHLWGGTFASREYLAEGVEGMIDLDETMRELLRQVFAEAAKSLAGSAKTGTVRTVAVVPLAGDVDRYATSLAEGMFSAHPSLSPRDLSVSTLAEAADLLRADPSRADAIMYGAVRDLSVFLDKEDVIRGDTYRYHAEVQLWIQTPAGDKLWSDTVSLGADLQEERDIPIEVANAAARNPRIVLMVVGGFLALLVVLVIIRMFLRAVSRPR
jgi:diadenosine tetraphosphatase ApaH/serine/threonine PP2A family protein phosphatase